MGGSVMACPEIIVYRGPRGRQVAYNLKVTTMLFDDEKEGVALFKRRLGSAAPFFMVVYRNYDGSGNSLEVKELSIDEAYSLARSRKALDAMQNIRSYVVSVMRRATSNKVKLVVRIDSELKKNMEKIQQRRSAAAGISLSSHQFSLNAAVIEACKAWVRKNSGEI